MPITYLDEEEVSTSQKITYLNDEESAFGSGKITYLDEPTEVIQQERAKPSFGEGFTGILKAFSSGTLKAAGRIPLPLPQGTEPLKPGEDPDIKMGSFADYLEKVVPPGTLEYEPKDMREQIAAGLGGAIQDLGQLAAAAKITAQIAPMVTNQILEKAPTIARVVGGLAAQSGATFGVKELVNQMADFYEDKVSAKGVISNTLLSTGFGVGLGAAGSIASPALRIPTEMAYGFMTAKIEGADNLDAGITAGIFGLFGLLKRQNLTKVYKQAAINGAQKALSKRLVKEGYEGLEAERFSRQFFQEGIEASGGIETVNIKKVDEAVKKVRAMEIARKPKIEGEAARPAKPEESLPPDVRPPEPISIPAEQILRESPISKSEKESALRDILGTELRFGNRGGETDLTIDAYLEDGILTGEEVQEVRRKLKSGEISPTLSPEEFAFAISPEGRQAAKEDIRAEKEKSKKVKAISAQPAQKQTYYSGTSKDKAVGKYLYLTTDESYAKKFGENVKQFQVSPENTLDITAFGEKSISFEKLKSTMKGKGVDITELMRDKDDDVHKPIWQWLRKYSLMNEAVKSAGYDSIKQIESFTGKDKKQETIVILDKSKAVEQPAQKQLWEKIKVYHGTKYQFNDFDIKHLGKLTKAESAKNAFFFTDKKEIAEGYANLGDMPAVEKLKEEIDRLEKIAQRTGRNSDWNKHQKALERYEDAALGEENKSFVGNVKEVYLDLKNPFVVDKEGFSYNEKELANWVKEAQEKGHDGLIIKNAADAVT